MTTQIDNLDRYDRAILSQLQANGRITVTELAHRVGLSKTPCQIRMRKLEEQGYIGGYSAQINSAKMGLSHIAFVQVTLNNTSSRALDAFNRAVRKISAVEQCHMMAAGFDYLIKVRTSDMASYRQVLGEEISALPHVQQTSTFVAMESVKDNEVPLLGLD